MEALSVYLRLIWMAFCLLAAAGIFAGAIILMIAGGNRWGGNKDDL